MLRRCLVAAHCLLSVRGGAFLSLLDPAGLGGGRGGEGMQEPAHVPGAGRGDGSGRGALLADHPVRPPPRAPESPGDLFDAGEIDEILTLRTLTLTDEEKREARATDPRAEAIVDRVDVLPKEVFARPPTERTRRRALACARRPTGRRGAG